MRRRSFLAAAGACGLALLAAIGPATAGRPPAGPAYRTYAWPVTDYFPAGEPTLGVDPRTGDVLFQAYTKTFVVSGFDQGGPGRSTWRDVAAPNTSIASFDPILEMDAQTGRTFVSQLVPGCSLLAYTDDRGASWTPVPLGCGAGAAVDHQSLGIGPYVAGGTLAGLPRTYPNVVYYCAQDIVAAACAPSVDGGNTFLPANVVYATDRCHLNALFGHPKAAPDGTVYLPPEFCRNLVTGAMPVGVAVSEDNGLSWTLRTVPDSTYGDAGHPSVAVAADGTVYLAWGAHADGSAGGPVVVATSRDKGRTWSKPVPLGGRFGIRNSRFPVAVAGDGDRAVVAYLGTPAGGDADAEAFDGAWRLYASHTYDRGATWTTVDVTPANPVQVGRICTLGTTCDKPSRNLLDFNDMVVDVRGRVFIAFADGCIVQACTRQTPRWAQATIARLVAGRGLRRAYDGRL